MQTEANDGSTSLLQSLTKEVKRKVKIRDSEQKRLWLLSLLRVFGEMKEWLCCECRAWNVYVYYDVASWRNDCDRLAATLRGKARAKRAV